MNKFLNKMDKKQFSLKKESKLKKIDQFFDKNNFFFIYNDLSLNLKKLLNNLVADNFIEYNSFVIKSKILKNFLLKKGFILPGSFNIKGSIIVFGVSNVQMFRLFLLLNENKNINDDLVFLILKNLIILKKDIPLVFNMFKNKISFFEYFVLYNIILKRKLLNLCTLNAFMCKNKNIK